MSPSELSRIESIFSRIADLAPSQRAQALDAECGQDPQLRAEVESLLRHAEPPARFLSGSVIGANLLTASRADAEDDQIGRLLGPYRIVSRCGSGGMGAVYFAERADGQFEQRVAIKVVKRGMDSEEILRRFEQERRTLATLNHPNMARLLDGGATPDGRPFLVMEFVDGVAIDRYCDEARLTISDRLRLFCKVCEAVRFAHQKLIIHRDLKPTNILVDRAGVPKLLDFGISKVLGADSDHDETIPEERRFTPNYASPEQVAGQPLTTATDVYSLGVVLYELVTGRRPHRLTANSAAALHRLVAESEPRPPSAVVKRDTATADQAPNASRSAREIGLLRGDTPDRLRRRLRGDIDTIILKAMQKDPARRYESVEQLAADIERHLKGLPVLARPDTLGYRTGKFMARHAVAVSFAMAAVLALVIGLGVATRERNAARRDRDAAYVARDQAEQTVDFLQNMLSAADPAENGPDATIRSLIDSAGARLDTILRDRPLVEAAIRSTIGRTYLGLGLYEQAEKHITAAYEARRKLLEPGAHDLAESEFDMARLLYAQQKFERAEQLLKSCLATHQRLRGDENTDTARVWNDLGAVQRAAGKIDEAEASLRRALEIRERVDGPDSLNFAETLNNLAGVRMARGDFAGSEKLMLQALAIRRRNLRAEHPLIAQSLANIAVIAGRRHDLKRSAELLREVIAVDRKVYGSQHLSLAVDLSSLGTVLIQDNRAADALSPLREAYEIRKRQLPGNDMRLIMTQSLLGNCLALLGRISDAEPLLADALEKSREHIEPGNQYWLEVAETLSVIYSKLGREDRVKHMAAIKHELSSARGSQRAAPN